MATPEDELKDLREKNNELVQRLQYWKVTAAQRETEKLDLMKEINELRLKLSRLRSNGNVQATNFDAALQSASEKALAHLVRASSEIATTMELAKAYMKDRTELDANSPRWSSIGSTPSSDRKDKVHRVPPMMMGGQSIQPVVSLSRTMLDISTIRSAARSPNQNRNVTERVPVPMHMLQDVYIPLTRIDATDLQTQNMDSESETNAVDNSADNLGLDDSVDRVVEDSEWMSDDEDYNSSRRLDIVTEDAEIEEEEEVTPPRNRLENPLEGPSWMLDASTDNQARTSGSRTTLEPDSTTEPDEGFRDTPPTVVPNNNLLVPQSVRTSVREFSPTIRRRKRTSSPAPVTPGSADHYSPRPLTSRRISNGGRVLKVLVAKMSLEQTGITGDVSPPKRRTLSPQFDAPSPNGATVAGVIVEEANESVDDLALDPSPEARRASQHDRSQHDRGHRDKSQHDRCQRDNSQHDRGQGDKSQDNRIQYERSRRKKRSNAEQVLERGTGTESRVSNSRSRRQDEHRSMSQVDPESLVTSRPGSNDSRDSDSSGGDINEGRTRRSRKVVTYKERPLNRKMRR